MSLKCFFGHQWNGCKCERCGTIRDEKHQYFLVKGKCMERCSICNKEREMEHHWVEDENCYFKCKICGEYKSNHVWKGFKCEKCGEVVKVYDMFTYDERQTIAKMANLFKISFNNEQEKRLYNTVEESINNYDQIIDEAFLIPVKGVLKFGSDDIERQIKNDPLSMGYGFHMGFVYDCRELFKKIEQKEKYYGSILTCDAESKKPLEKQCGTDKQFSLFTGNGVCDVCNSSLNGRKAYVVPNNVFYNSKKYRDYIKNGAMAKITGIPINDTYFAQMQASDQSQGSAVCENCIYMFNE